MLKPWSITSSHEDLFIQRYGQLLGWSLQLTNHNLDQAEDLVHNAFIQFTLGRPDLGAINNLEGYLYTTLKNMHLSQVRRAARIASRSLASIDYDSAEISLQAADSSLLVQVRDELRKVCHYACLRKDTSKTGSVLILRFFHGYYPNEISRILKGPRRAVDDSLRIARREARLYIDEYPRLGLIRKNPLADTFRAGAGQTTVEFLLEMRRAIFRSRSGDCLSKEQLYKHYKSEDTTAIDSVTLGHIVSCPDCLDEVNRLLGLAPLSDRYPTDMLGPDTHPKGGSGAAPRTSDREKACHRRARQVFEHTPQELFISVNGFILGSQSIGAEVNEQTLSVNLAEKIGFVEILSEQGIRLLFHNVEVPPDGPVEQPARVELSDNRALEMLLSFSDPWPKIHAVYRDPVYRDPTLDAARAAQTEEVSAAPASITQSATQRLMELIERWLAGLKILLRPGAVTAMLAVLLISVILIVRMQPVSAAELLRRSGAREEAIAGNHDLVLHRVLNLEKRRSSELLSRRRIEVWSSGASGLKVRRIYDEKGRLVAGEWTEADGKRTVYRQKESGPQTGTDAGLDLPFSPWQLELSAKSFSSLIEDVEAATVEEKPAVYIIGFEPSVTGPDLLGDEGELLKATLTLSRADLHPIEQVLFVRSGDEVLEYRLRETAFRRLPRDSVAPKVFQPDPELISGANELREEIDSRNYSSNEPARMTAAALVELEVEALYRLHQVGVCLREQANFSRAADGGLQVETVVASERRKAEILEALNPVMNRQGVRVEVLTVGEAIKQQMKRPPRPAIARRVEITKGRIPVYAELEEHFRGEGTDEQVEEQIRRFASRALNRSRTALLHAWELKHLIEQVSPERLTAESEAKWRLMIREHARVFQQETSLLGQQLQPIFFPGAESGGHAEADDSNIVEAIRRLFELGSNNEEAIREAFALSADSPTTAVIKTAQFWHWLKSAEELASRIQKR